MDINDFIQYKDKFTENAFVDKVSKIAKRAGSKLVYAALVLYYTLQSDKVSLKDKAIIIGALGYLVAPIDAMPDIIPIAGLGDDLAVLLFVLEKVWGDVTDDIQGKAKAKLAKWFDDDEIVKAEDVFTEEPQDIPV